MDSDGKAFRRMETELIEKEKNRGTNGGGDQVVVVIPHEQDEVTLSTNRSYPVKEEMQTQAKDSSLESLQTARSTVSTISRMSSVSLEGSKFSPSPNRPPKIPTGNLTRRHSLARSAFSKPKSRFVEPSGPIVSSIGEEGVSLSNSPYKLSSSKKVSFSEIPLEGLRSMPGTPRTPWMEETDEEDEDIYKIESVATMMEQSRKKWEVFALIEWITLIIIWACLISSLTIRSLQHHMVWGLEIWKWLVLVLVSVCGRLMTKGFVHVLVYLIEMNFLLKNKVLYFIYGVRMSVQVFIWLALVLLCWALLINRGVKRSKHTAKILNHVSRALISSLVGALVWMIKTLLVKLLATNFQCSRFFDRIQESLFHQYVLKTLSGLPFMELAETIGSGKSQGQLSFRSRKKGKGDIEQEIIDVNKLHRMKQDKVSAWTMKGLVNVVTTSGLVTISNTIDGFADEVSEKQDKEITNEWEAKAAALMIFRNVAKPDTKFIDENDLLRFLTKAEVDNVLPLFEGAAEIGKIKRSALKNWVVKVYHDRKSLAHSLNDTQSAVTQLNNIISSLVIVVIVSIWLLIMGIATVQVFVFISSQMLVAAFMFGNTAKTVFESIIFVFVMHPFDVGDRCVIDDVQMVVEEMNILTTVFLRYDNEKIYYPNSVLVTKPISNFYRSPDMGDNIDFSIDVSTPFETIGLLKARIKTYPRLLP